MEPWPPPSRLAGRIRRRWLVLGLAVLVALPLAIPASIVAWLFLSAEDPAPYVATLDSLNPPPTWEVVHTQSVRSFLGSRATRSYLVDAEPTDIAPVVEEVLRSAGLEIYDQDAPACRENGSGGPVSCTVEAFRWLRADPSLEKAIVERVLVNVSPRGETFDVGVSDQRHQIDGRNRALVTVSADQTSARSFWSSPTPPASGATSPP
jgi:hypothetical protein